MISPQESGAVPAEHYSWNPNGSYDYWRNRILNDVGCTCGAKDDDAEV